MEFESAMNAISPRCSLLVCLLLLALAPPARGAEWHRCSPGDTTRPMARTGHFVVLDAPGRRLIAWGDRIPPGEVWALALDGPAEWRRMETLGTPPPPRILGSAIFDPIRRRMILFGGGSHESTNDFLNDVWALELDGTPQWTELHPAGPVPDPRHMHAAIYDAPRERMIVFGGISSSQPPAVTYETSVWALSLGDSPAWTNVSPAGPGPDWRLSPSMVYDAANERAIVFGGYNYLDPSNGYRNDAWSLSLSGTPAWSRLAPGGTPPSARYEHVAVMDQARERMLVFGGRGLNVIANSETWSLSLGSGAPQWTQLGASTIAPRFNAGAVLDPLTDRLVIDGGSLGGSRLIETFAMPLGGPAAWQDLTPDVPPSAPPPRIRGAPLVDPVAGRLLMQGGYDYTAATTYPKDLWSWSLTDPASAWVRVRTDVPGGDMSEPVLLDPVRGRQLRFFHVAGEVEAMPLDGSGDWVTLDTQGSAPPPRYGYSLAYDPSRDRVLFTGGYVDSPRGHSRQYYSDLWALSLAEPPTWQQLRPDGSGPTLHEDALVYDAVRDRILGVGNSNGGTWVTPADGSADWTLLQQNPPGWWNPGVALDLASQSLLAVDLGHMGVWQMPLDGSAGWSMIATQGTLPVIRESARTVFDAEHRRLLVFGGRALVGFSTTLLGDLWALDLDPPATAWIARPSADPRAYGVRLTWPSALPAGTVVTLERRHENAAWTSVAKLPVEDAGALRYEDRGVTPGERLGYRLVTAGTPWVDSEVWVTVLPFPSLALAGARPNPTSGSPSLAFTLAGTAPATIELFDLAGRRVESREVGDLGPGEHVVRLGAALRPGIYLARLRQHGRAVTARLAVTR